MWLINLTISLFSILKVKALECVSVINQKCMPRPKILDVNEGVGKALFYPYNVLINKCSGSCNALDNPMTKFCVPNVIKRANMQVYNLLMRLNETRNVLWHESYKCVCKLNSSVCECQCDTWCKPGQYLDHKNYICKNKLIGRVTEECTSVINETMINNKDNITNNNNNNTYLISFIVFLIGFIAF